MEMFRLKVKISHYPNSIVYQFKINIYIFGRLGEIHVYCVLFLNCLQPSDLSDGIEHVVVSIWSDSS